MKVLDLFSGGKSLKKPCIDMGFEYYSVDIDNKLMPDLVADIGTLSAPDIQLSPDIIWASPPCTCFSVASIGVHWEKINGNLLPKTTEAKNAISLILNTLKLIGEINPKYWFIENPRGALRKMFFMELLPIRHTVTYCQYGFDRMKPTDIWTNNTTWNPKPPCKNGDICHKSAPRGSRTGTQGRDLKEKWSVPYNLQKEILISCNEI